MIDFGVDQNIFKTEIDYLFLTSLLHEKNDSAGITFGDIEPLFQHYAGVNQFGESVEKSTTVLSKLSLVNNPAFMSRLSGNRKPQIRF